MFHVIFAFTVFFALVILLLLSVFAGRRFGLWQMKRNALTKLEVISVLEGAVFALLGLMIAFTFTGAYDRFETRKLHIIEEANAVDTAYLMLDMLAPNTQPALRQNFRLYVDTRLNAYKDIPNLKAVNLELEKSAYFKKIIWKQILAACKTTNDQTVTQLIVPAITKMFEVENTGYAITGIHPPGIVFHLLIGLAMLSAFLAGYTTAENKKGHSSVYILTYVLITAFIICIIIELELPRIGMIRVDSFDYQLMNVRQAMDK